MTDALKTAIDKVGRTGNALKKAKARQIKIDNGVQEADATVRRTLEQVSAAARREAYEGRQPNARLSVRRRNLVADQRDQLSAYEAVRPVALEELGKAEAAHVAAMRDLGSLAVPALHERRLAEAAQLPALLMAALEQAARVAAIDRVQRYFAGETPYVRSLPEGFYFAEPLVEKLISAIPKQLLDNPFLADDLAAESTVYSQKIIAELKK